MEHLYTCEYLSKDIETNKPIFEKIFENNIVEQKRVNTLFLLRYQRRMERNQTTVISSLDPLYYSDSSAVMDI